MNEKTNLLKELMLAHRYLYYVECMPVISDFEYDELEKTVRALLPLDEEVQGPGSDLRSSYSPLVRLKAEELLHA